MDSLWEELVSFKYQGVVLGKVHFLVQFTFSNLVFFINLVNVREFDEPIFLHIEQQEL